jgi:5-methylcytosine-specific restriction protein A
MAESWSIAELDASVQAYNSMLTNEKASKRYSKKATYKELAAKFGRTEKAFEYRMQNISHVLNSMGREWISGLKPAKNVGNKIANIVERQILILDGQDPATVTLAFPETALVREFDRNEDGELTWPYRADFDDANGLTKHDLAEWDRQYTLDNEAIEPPTPPKGKLHPEEIPSTRKEFSRDSAVVAWVLARSKGNCECCESQWHPLFRSSSLEAFGTTRK